MAKSELLDAIRDAFEIAQPSVDALAISAFCDFAADWLARAGILGVGHTANGLALRMRDGSEKLLVNLELEPTVADTPAVGIGVNGVSARQGIGGGEAPSIRITGRSQ
jgi:hypothetical protein